MGRAALALQRRRRQYRFCIPTTLGDLALLGNQSCQASLWGLRSAAQYVAIDSLDLYASVCCLVFIPVVLLKSLGWPISSK